MSVTENVRPAQVTRLAIYDGKVRIGEIEDRGRHGVAAFVVHDGRSVPVGLFKDRRAAMRAVTASGSP